MAGSVDDRAGRRPDPGLPAGGHDVGGQVAGAVGGQRDDRPLVGAAIAVEPTEGNEDPASRQRRRSPHLLHLGRQARGVDRPVPPDGPAGQVEGEELVVRPVGQEGDHVDGPGGPVDDRRAGDPRRVDVAARQGLPGDGLAEVGLPHHGAGVAGQGVDGVALGGHDDLVAGDERLGVDRAVERRRRPRLPGRAERPLVAGHAGAGGVLVVGQPVVGGRQRRGGDGRGGGRRRGRRGGGRAGRGRGLHRPAPFLVAGAGAGGRQGEGHRQRRGQHRRPPDAHDPDGSPSGRGGVTVGVTPPELGPRPPAPLTFPSDRGDGSSDVVWYGE